MKAFNSKIFTVRKDLSTIHRLASNPSLLQPLVERVGNQLPFKELSLTDKSIAFQYPGLGEVVVERVEAASPNQIRYESTKAPIPLAVVIHLKETNGGAATEGQLSVEANVPSFLSGIVESRLKPGLDQLAEKLELIDLDRLNLS